MELFFITGWQRSGTTLLARIFNAHPNIVCLYQPFSPLFKYAIKKFLKEFCYRNLKQDFPVGSYLLANKNIRELIWSKLENLYLSKGEIEKIKKDLIIYQKDNCESAPYIIDYLWMLKDGFIIDIFFRLFDILEEAYKKDNTLALGFKELYCEPIIPVFLKYGIKVFHIIRDVRAVFSSRNYGKYCKNLGNLRYPIAFIIDNWRLSVLFSSYYKHKYYKVVRYEDLVLYPKEIVNNCLSVLKNVEYIEEMLCPSRFHDGCGNLWNGNSSFDLLNKIDISAIDRWKNILSEVEIYTLNFCCFHELKLMKYEVENKNLHSLFNYREDNIVEWIKKYDFFWNNKRIHYEIARKFVIENHELFLTSEFVYNQFISPKMLKLLANIDL